MAAAPAAAHRSTQLLMLGQASITCLGDSVDIMNTPCLTGAAHKQLYELHRHTVLPGQKLV